jgi:hypothetical protein
MNANSLLNHVHEIIESAREIQSLKIVNELMKIPHICFCKEEHEHIYTSYTDTHVYQDASYISSRFHDITENISSSFYTTYCKSFTSYIDYVCSYYFALSSDFKNNHEFEDFIEEQNNNQSIVQISNCSNCKALIDWETINNVIYKYTVQEYPHFHKFISKLEYLRKS